MADTPLDTNTLRTGNAKAFDRLYAAFAPRVLGYLLRLTGGKRAEAEDLTQETFLVAFANRDRCSGTSLLAWLLGIARRRQRDTFRAELVRPRTQPFLSDPEKAEETDSLDETVARRTVLIHALDRLEEKERDAVLLVVVQGLTYAEAAQILGEPVGTVKWRVHEATVRLRKLLSSTFSPEMTTENKRKEINHYVEAALGN